MTIKRTIYADKDGLYNRLMVQRAEALSSAAHTGLPHYKKQYWKGQAQGLEIAANLIRDWAGETEPEPRTAKPLGPIREHEFVQHPYNGACRFCGLAEDNRVHQDGAGTL